MSGRSSADRRAPTRRAFLAGMAGAAAGALVASCADARDGGAASETAAPGRPPRREQVRYGDHRLQRVELHRPDAPTPWPVVVLIHGGFWRRGYRSDLMAFLADDLVSRRYAVWNVEYRSSGDDGGGWPGTFDDVAAAVDSLRGVGDVDLDRVAVVGHSAGGHLALWAAARPDAAFRVRVAVAQAGVLDLTGAARAGLGAGAVQALLDGGPDERPDRYTEASPVERVPIGVPMVLVHGAEDDVVPVGQSEEMHTRARAAGDESALVVVPGAGHFEHLDPAHQVWTEVTQRLDAALA